MRLLWVLSLIALFAGCSRKPPSDVLRFQLGGEPVTLDPALAEDGLSLRVLANTMEGLVGYDGAGKLQDFLAASHELSPDGKRLEFRLKPDVKWSDGKPITVSDFLVGFHRALKPGVPSKLAELLLPIRGARDYRAGRSQKIEGLRDEGGKLVVELEAPVSYFLQVMTLAVALPSRQDVLDSHHGSWPLGPHAEEAPVTGPYVIRRHLPDQKLVLEANPFYRGPAPKIRKVELLIVKDESTGVNLFDRGGLDILTKIPSLEFARLKSKGVVRTDPFFATYYIAFNCSKEPFTDRDWRRAVSASIRRKEITDALATGEIPARGWVPPGIEGAFPGDAPGLDAAASIAKVRALAPKHAPIAAQFDASDRNGMILEKIEQDLKNGLGVKVFLNNLDWKSHIKSVQSDAPQIYRLGWMAPFFDPITHLQAFTTGNPNNSTHCSMPEYDQLVKQIERDAPGPAREAKIRRAQKILVDDEAAVVPIYHYVQNTAVSPRVEHFRTNPFGAVRFDELELKK